MTEYLRSSVLLRLLARLGAAIKACWEDSRLCAALHDSAVLRALGRFFRALLSMTDAAVQNSRFARLGQRISEALHRRKPLRACWESSVLRRIYAAVITCGQNSFLFGWAFRGGMTRLLLTVLGLYAGVDYVLRDVLSIPVLSSVWDEALLLLCCFWVLWQRTASEEPMHVRANPLDGPVLFHLVMGLVLMACVHPYPSIQIAGYRASMQYILWFFVITRMLRHDEDFFCLYWVMLALAALIALHGIYQYIIAVPIPSSWMTSTETAVRTRVFSIFGSPNIMGDYMVIFAPMAVGMAYSVKDWRLKLVCWAGGILMCCACLFTMSRGAWMAMALAVILFVFMVDRRLLLVLLGAAIIALSLPFVSSRLGFLFTDAFTTATNNGGRASRWLLAMNLLRRHDPVLGVGHGMFGGAVAMQNQVLNCQYFYVDNYYLKTLVEMGYVGLASFIFLQVSTLFTGARCLMRTAKAKQAQFFPLCAGMFSGLSGVLLHCYFENIFEEPYMEALYWIIAAMLVYVGFLRRPSAETAQTLKKNS